MMPFATEETNQPDRGKSEECKLRDIHLDQGKTPEELLEILLGNVGLEITDTIDTQFTVTVRKRE